MRMLIITYRLPIDLCSGDQLTIHHMLKFFSKRHEIVFVAPASRQNLARVDLIAPYCKRVEVVPFERWQSYRNCAGGLLSSDPLQVRYFRSPGMSDRIQEIFDREKIDLAYAYHLRSGQYLADHDGCPRVLDLKPVQTLNLRRMKDHVGNPLKRLLYTKEYQRVREYEPRLVKKFDQCCIISETDRAAFDPGGELDNLMVNPHGLDTDFFAPDSSVKKEPASIVFTGYMKYEPNADAAVYFCDEIYPLIKQRVPNVKLYLVGKAPPPKVVALGNDPSVTVTGTVDDIRPYLNRSVVAIDPLRIGAGLQNKVLEGMSMGMPMVVTGVANEGIGAVEGKQILVGDTPGEFAEHVVSLIEDRPMREAVGSAAREFMVRNWSWDKHFEDLEEMFLRLVREHRQPAAPPHFATRLSRGSGVAREEKTAGAAP